MTDSAHRPHGVLRALASTTTSNGIAGMSTAFDRDVGMRARRIKSLAVDHVTQRLRPTRPKMRSMAVGPGGRTWWRDIAAPPDPAPGAAVVHPIAIATCDLDRALTLGRTPIPLPLHLGHECVAEVISVGDGVSTVQPGDRVVVPYQISCGSCRYCTNGRTAHCRGVPPMAMYGFGLTGGNWGGFVADLVTVPFADAMLVALPAGVSPAAAASVSDTVTSAYSKVAQHASMVRGYGDDARVVIVGEIGRRMPVGGSMALYAGLAARALGMPEVHFVDRDSTLRALAEQLGFHAHVPSRLTTLPKAPLVFDASGTTGGLAAAVRRVADGGVCCSTGSLHHATSVPTSSMYLRGVSLQVGMTSVRPTIPAVLDLMASGALQPELATTDIVSIDNAPDAIRAYATGNAPKLVLTE